ncbi:hypothetical protein [Agromyces sp. Soil535]|uniref:Ig-like domain-containing protein n=1 Tax=Agromyces sp. Soil535 TaxID=1736390 RepID=UPI0007022CAE|nr:hypothetical protein [Agromyces sp. Soil535]KRE21013.1 hypothetical protein ASG80_15215 [Agromyces sp. Soil535]
MAGATGRGITAAVFAVVILAVASAAPSGATAVEVGPPVAGPTDIAVPYLGTATIEPAEGWQIVDCDGSAAASPLVVACHGDRIELAATTYDPDAGATVIPVALTNGRTAMTFDYAVTTEPPEAPTVAVTRTAAPAAAGSVVMVPISDVGIECLVCANGGALEVVGVRPVDAGTAVATSTHVVFRASAGFSGEAEVVVRFLDDYGTASLEASHFVPVYRPNDSALVALSVFAPLEASGATTLDLASLVFPTADSEVRFLGCGAAVHGGVVCAADGTAEYTPLAETAVDQFSFQVASSDGEQATGSVTLVAQGAGLPTAGPAPASGADDGEPVASAIVPAQPVERDGDEREGAFAVLIGTMDRVGAR